MKKITIILALVGGCFGLTVGCHSGQKDSQSSETESRKINSVKASSQQLRDEIDSQYDDALAEKVSKMDQAPPRIDARMEAVKFENISENDVGHSWMFGKAAFERCYSVALARDENAAGDVVFALKRQKGEAKPEVVSFSSEIKVEKFEDCIKASLPRWPVPEGASYEVRIKLKPLPGLTGDDFDKLSDEHRKHEH